MRIATSLILLLTALGSTAAAIPEPPPSSTPLEKPAFPSLESDVRPHLRATQVRTQLLHTERGRRFRFLYQASDGVMEICLEPSEWFWGAAIVKINRIPVGTVLSGAAPRFESPIERVELVRAWADGETARAQWKGFVGEQEVEIESALRLWEKTLIVEFSCPGGLATGLSYGRITDVREPALVTLPESEFRELPVTVLKGGGVRPFYASLWTHSRPSSGDAVDLTPELTPDGLRLEAPIRYRDDAAGRRKDLFERFFITLSEQLDETLPVRPRFGP